MANLQTGEKGISLIKGCESIHDGDLTQIGLQPKLCPAGIWTVGWGHALYYNGKPLRYDDYHLIAVLFPQFSNMTIQQADALFLEDLKIREKLVHRYLKIPVMQTQFDALVSFVFNCGYSETLFALVNGAATKETLADWWTTHYITSNGKQLAGLVIRRKKEFDLYCSVNPWHIAA